MYLEREGFSTITAKTGAEALDLVVSRQPSLVVLDIMLPDIDGWRSVARFGDPLTFLLLCSRPVKDEDKIVGLELAQTTM
jgi:DNA-binding response OmpR family regulator